MKTMGVHPKKTAALLAIALLAFTAATATAAETSREEFVAAAEPICKTNTEANERILAKVRTQVRKGELKPSAISFEKAAEALAGTLGELKALPQPKADAARLESWFSDIEVEVGLFKATAAKLRSGDRAGAERMSAKLTRAAAQANDEVLPFEFRSCCAEPSRFV
jgi:hypothetical protein